MLESEKTRIFYVAHLFLLSKFENYGCLSWFHHSRFLQRNLLPSVLRFWFYFSDSTTSHYLKYVLLSMTDSSKIFLNEYEREISFAATVKLDD